MLPPLDDGLATAASEFDTLDELRADITDRIRELLEREVESQFRIAAVDELLKASNVEPAALVVDMRTRDLLNAFVRQLEARGIDPVAYLRATGISGADLEQRFREEARQQIGRELLLEAVADKLAIEVTRRRDPRGSARGRRERRGHRRVHRGGRRRPRPTGSAAQKSGRSDRRRGEADLAGAREGAREHLDAGQGRRRHGREETVDTRHKE